MLFVLILVFVAVFVLIALPLGAMATGPSHNPRQVRVALDSALAGENIQSRGDLDDLRRASQLSSIPWLNRKLLRMEVTPHLHRKLSQARLEWSVGRLLSSSGVCFAGVGYLVYFRFHSTLAGLATGAAAACLPYLYVMRRRASRFSKFEEYLPNALDLIVSALRAGHSLILATGVVARECPEPVSGEFRICFEEQNYGLDLKSALDNMLERVPLQDLRIVATAIMIQKETGGNLAEVLDKTAHAIRERFRLKREIKTYTAQGKLTGWILTALPLVVGVLMFFVNPQMVSVLWTDPLGIKLMWSAGGMIVLGGLIIRSIVNIDV